ncbi:hypothetical protein D3C77_725600 [compost metagenome]
MRFGLACQQVLEAPPFLVDLAVRHEHADALFIGEVRASAYVDLVLGDERDIDTHHLAVIGEHRPARHALDHRAVVQRVEDTARGAFEAYQ